MRKLLIELALVVAATAIIARMTTGTMGNPATPGAVGATRPAMDAGWPVYGGDGGGMRYSATPMTYAIGGRQNLVIAAGGYKGDSTRGDYLIAYALPP